MFDEIHDRPGIPLLGDKFPDADVVTTQGPMKLPDAFKGKWFVLFSHPADFTPVCTTEFYAFMKRYDRFQNIGCELIGLSVDQVFSHIKWVEWIRDNLDTEVKFPIIADQGDLARKMGMIHPGKGSNTVRAVFIVDKDGVIRAMIYYPQEVGRSIDEVLRAVEALQTSDEKKMSMPEGWPRNELIGDEAIIPPPKNVKDAMAKKKGPNCYDWWFCHKKISGRV
ncbi:MAG: peroxiredoxin [Methanomassiliicoccales archaeon]|jgi:peroxiredoxin (alkyl hydroperoxide reductase subunit C)